MTSPRPVLDVACGGRMMWFDKEDARATFVDQRSEEPSILANGQRFEVSPDLKADFRNLPFAENSFYHVVFDPPHLISLGTKSWTAKKYGALLPSWEDDLRAGFAECFRVLKPGGTLIFKWNEDQIPVSKVLSLTPEKPLYGHRSGKASKTHWLAFIKEISK